MREEKNRITATLISTSTLLET